MATSGPDAAGKHWWGEFDLPVGVTAEWQIGLLEIAIQRSKSEWLVAHQMLDLEEEGLEWYHNIGKRELDQIAGMKVSRLTSESTDERLIVRPMLADRPVVVKPFAPFTVPAEDVATIYVSSPTWVEFLTGSPPKTLVELPTRRPSDTWFGPSTMEGEASYATRTYGRLNLDNVAIRPNRAVTQIQIQNKSSGALLVERISLPTPYLSLFAAQDGHLWTQAVSMVQTHQLGLARFEIEELPPEIASEARLVSEPRQRALKGMLIRAFSAFNIGGF